MTSKIDSVYFDEETHKYYDSRGELPSVTTIINEARKFQFTVCDTEAMERGRRVHEATKMLDTSLNKDILIDDDILPYVQAYQKYLETCKPTYISVEKPYADSQFRFAGTPDRITKDGVIDIKTGATKGEPMQLAAYWRLAIANNIIIPPTGIFLYLSPDGFSLEKIPNLQEYLKVFLSCLYIYNYFRGGKP